MRQRIIITAAMLVLAAGGKLLAQSGGPVEEASAYRLRGRHAISLSVGVMANTANEVSVTAGSGVRIGGSSHAVGWVGYGYWFQDRWAIQIETGVVATRADVTAGTSGVGTEASSVTPILVGLRLQPELSPGSAVRPFFSVMAGPYFGFSSRTGTPALVEVGTQTAAGARLGAGLDILLGHRFKLGTELRYHAMTDFDWPSELRDNYSGAEFVLGFGILLGREQARH